MSLLPKTDPDTALFDITVMQLKSAHPVLRNNPQAAGWFNHTADTLRAHVAWSHGNEYALDKATRPLPEIPADNLSPDEIETLKKVLIELKEAADYKEYDLGLRSEGLDLPD